MQFSYVLLLLNLFARNFFQTIDKTTVNVYLRLTDAFRKGSRFAFAVLLVVYVYAPCLDQ